MIKRGMVSILICLFCFLLSAQGNIRQTGIQLLSENNGLGNNSISYIYQDKDRFIWLGSEIGLSRYDGIHFHNFNLIEIEPVGIKKICESDGELLWLKTLQEGKIACFDKDRGKYLPLIAESTTLLNEIADIYASGPYLYAALPQGVAEITTEKNGNGLKLSQRMLPNIPKNIHRLYGNGGVLYAITVDNQLIIYNTQTGKSENVSLADLGITQSEQIEDLHIYSDYIWICSRWAGITCYNSKTHAFRRLEYSVQQNLPNLQSTHVRDIVQIDKNNLIIATWNALYEISFSNPDYLNSPFQLKDLTANNQYFGYMMKNRITNLHYDSQHHNLWIGTFGKGLLQLQIGGNEINHIKLSDEIYCINGVVQDANGYLWLVTDQTGVYKSIEKEVTPDMHFANWAKSNPNGSYCIHKDRNGNLLMGDEKGNILYTNPLTGETQSFTPLPAEKANQLSAIKVLYQTSRNHLWVVMDKGMAIFDFNAMACKNYMPYTKETGKVTSIAEDGDGMVWVGTEHGLKTAQYTDTQITLSGDYEKNEGLSPEKVLSLYVNTYNQIFVSYSNKIMQIDGRDKKVTSTFILEKGLPHGYINCMIDDKDGNTWLGSNAGIMTVRNKDNTFFTYLMSGNNLNVCRLNDGRLIWSNSPDLLYFDPRTLKAKGSDRRLFISDIDVNYRNIEIGEEINGQVILPVPAHELKELNLNSDNNNVILYVSDLRYTNMQNKILYRMLPKDTTWHESYNNQITLSDLKAGNYTLEIKPIYPNADEEQVTSLAINVTRYWAVSVWAILFYVVVGGILLFFGMRYVNHKKLKRESFKNKEIKLKEELQEVTESRDEEQRSHQVRNYMQASIARELRTPLSLITGPLREMIKNKELSSALLKQAQLAYRNSISIQNSCNQLLDIYEQDNYNSSLEIAPYPASKISDAVVRSFYELLNSGPITLHYDKDNKINTEIYIDRKKIEFVLRNMLSNAYHHISYSGAVWCTVTQTLTDDKGYCIFTISDSAKRNVNVDGDNIISPDTEGNDSSIPELGISLMENIARGHHGEITMTHKEDEGTQVTLRIPLGKKHFDNDSNITFIEPEEIIIEEEPKNEMESIAEERNEANGEWTSKLSNNGKCKLLIVEDHKDIRLYLKVLFSHDYTLLMAENGEEGVKMARKELPDLIITDVMMPVMDGFECCKRIKEDLKTCHIPVILLTALIGDEDVVKGIELGADDYILKPFNPEILRTKVKRLIKSRLELKQIYTKLLMPSGNPLEDSTEDVEKVEDPFIAQILQIVEENLQNPDFSVKRLSEMLNMSQPTLYRRVKQITNFTIVELVRGVRLKRSAELLKTRQYNVQEVAEMVGYNDIPTFRKHFVDFYGTTPSSFSRDEAER